MRSHTSSWYSGSEAGGPVERARTPCEFMADSSNSCNAGIVLAQHFGAIVCVASELVLCARGSETRDTIIINSESKINNQACMSVHHVMTYPY